MGESKKQRTTAQQTSNCTHAGNAVNANTDASLTEAVVQFISEELRVSRERIRADSRLREDLRLDGDDADEVLLAFSEKFHVQLGEFHLADHFGPEASWNPTFLKRKRRLPITIQDLINSAAAGVWQIRAKQRHSRSSE